jgi:hypothetical protein
MSKQLTPADLAKLVTALLTNPESVGELDTDPKFKAFVTDIAETVCNHCGGEVRNPADYLDDICYIGIHGNESLPPDGGVWKGFDTEGELFESEGNAQ